MDEEQQPEPDLNRRTQSRVDRFWASLVSRQPATAPEEEAGL